jgi:hypothetical protein
MGKARSHRLRAYTHAPRQAERAIPTRTNHTFLARKLSSAGLADDALTIWAALAQTGHYRGLEHALDILGSAGNRDPTGGRRSSDKIATQSTTAISTPVSNPVTDKRHPPHHNQPSRQ